MDAKGAKLSIVWASQEVVFFEEVEHSRDESDHAETKNGLDRLALSFVKDLSIENAPITDFFLYIDRAIRLNPSVIPTAFHLDEREGEEEGALLPSHDATAPLHTHLPTAPLESPRPRRSFPKSVKTLFDEVCKNNFENSLFRCLEGAVLSADMMSMMGFQLTNQDAGYAHFLDTGSPDWRTPELATSAASFTAASSAGEELEEGEEVEECEGAAFQ